MFGETDSIRTTFPLCFTLTGMSDIFPMGIQRPTKSEVGALLTRSIDARPPSLMANQAASHMDDEGDVWRFYGRRPVLGRMRECTLASTRTKKVFVSQGKIGLVYVVDRLRRLGPWHL